MAIAEAHLAAEFNRPGHTVIDHFTYALVTDGDLMEGISAEAASLAGHLALGKLTWLYDANEVTLDGPLALAMSEDVGKRSEHYVIRIRDARIRPRNVNDRNATSREHRRMLYRTSTHGC